MALWARGSFVAHGVAPQGTKESLLQTRPVLSPHPAVRERGLRVFVDTLGEMCTV